ncbi:hypothetical protein [Enterovibrio nigricans]|uniref:Uncharacterized protein n=1 Tax=Enterovibrio nigricans DSM 22720 TaxID=1121868 RepID=A0A1T4UET7_9GAMM|nr:hypothetical protein [Enterovibrio nigricans]SKA51116.1 hypothetical protein SAMN02745132_01548 [Enterovibrio nigricans DSM 22720]
MQKEKPIQATLVEFPCDCGKGFYRVDESARVVHTNPKQWKHKCSACGKETHFAFPYSMVKYKGQEFVLAKHIRFEGNDHIK